MPIYEYECAVCGYYLEVMQKISDAALKKCPSCGRLRLKRLISAPVFRLKGSGWYETDFKSDKEGQRNLAAGAEREETKPAAATETAAAAKPDAAAAPATPAAKPAATAATAATAAAATEPARSRRRPSKVAAAKRPLRRPAVKPKRGKRR